MIIRGIQWDDGNWPKCGKHGLDQDAVNELLAGDLAILGVSKPGHPESRFIGIGTISGRHALVVFCLRAMDGSMWLRPISARFMRDKEVAHYERQSGLEIAARLDE